MGRRARGVLLFAFASLVLASAGAGAAQGATLTVCPSGCAFSQIAPAIAVANPGDTIQVAAERAACRCLYFQGFLMGPPGFEPGTNGL